MRTRSASRILEQLTLSHMISGLIAISPACGVFVFWEYAASPRVMPVHPPGAGGVSYHHALERR